MLEARRLVAGGGLGAVTHRSVEAAAGVPHGSVTYWFGSRDGLVDAIVDDLVAESRTQVLAIADQVAAGLAAGAPDLEAIAHGLAAWIDGGRERHLARLELELAAVREPRLRERMFEASQVFVGICIPLAEAIGSDDPPRDGRAMAAMVDGLLLDRLARPSEGTAVLVAALGRLLSSWRSA